MTNKNIPRKNVCTHLPIQKSDDSIVPTKLEFDESYIRSRRPTRLSLKLLSRAKESHPVVETEELPHKKENI